MIPVALITNLLYKLAFHGHVAGAYENEEGHIVCDLTIADGNVFYWWPPENSSLGPNPRQKLNADTHRWTFDPNGGSGTRVAPAELYGTNGEFSRIDERFVTKKYRHFWQLQIDPSRPYDMAKCGPPAGGLFNVSHCQAYRALLSKLLARAFG